MMYLLHNNFIECPPNMFGQNCESTCTCNAAGGTCDHISGTCTCNPGYTGTNCEQCKCSNTL